MVGEAFKNLREFYEVKDLKTLKEFVEYGWSSSTMGKFTIKVGEDKALYFHNTGQYGVDVAVKIRDEFEEFENLSPSNDVEFLATVGLMYHALSRANSVEEFLEKADYAYVDKAVVGIYGDKLDEDLMEMLAPWSEFYEKLSEAKEYIRKLETLIWDTKGDPKKSVVDTILKLYDHNLGRDGEYVVLIRGVSVEDSEYLGELFELAVRIYETLGIEDWSYEDLLRFLSKMKAFWIIPTFKVDLEV